MLMSRVRDSTFTHVVNILTRDATQIEADIAHNGTWRSFTTIISVVVIAHSNEPGIQECQHADVLLNFGN